MKEINGNILDREKEITRCKVRQRKIVRKLDILTGAERERE